MFGLLPVLFIALDVPAILGFGRTGCPIIDKKDVTRSCSSRIENFCFSDDSCSAKSKCCPTSRDGGCSLMCVEARVLEGCPIPLDFAMIVDASGSISRRNFKKLLDFIQDLLDGFDISEEGTHIAVIEYSTKASVQIKFNDFSGAQLHAPNIKRKIRGIPHSRGYTYIDKALKLANTSVFSEEGGMRPDVTKVALVMTDGQQTVQEEGVISSDILSAAVQPLKEKNVRVISLGIGSNTNLFDLLTIASSDNDVFLAENFETLKGLVSDLAQNKCPVHGNWSQWGGFGACSVTCGGGLQIRLRTCDNPPPAFGGDDCVGESEEIRPCNEFPCAVNGGWAEWKPWGTCPVTCGEGIQSRTRTCTNPPPTNGGADCEGEGALSRPCNENPCPVDGKWTNWKAWSQCNVTCGGGIQGRSRTCTNPPPQHGGEDCSGNSEEQQSCNDFPCPIDGKWANWKAWSQCSVTCGGGTQSRSRTCTNPPPQHRGEDCSGDSEEERSCNDFPCPINGKWANWKAWSQCSVTCGGGTQSRSRFCTNPPPQHGGEDCSGDSEDVRSCNEDPCPIDGKWTEWKPWEPCPVTCGGGVQNSQRTCTDPAPAFGGADCEGDSERFRPCNERGCPADGNWSPFGQFKLCSVTCGGGTRSRSRSCTNPPPKFEGADCVGDSEDVEQCNDFPCPGDGSWSRWKPWGPCSVTCAGGVQRRSRTCTNPPPTHGGKDCEGNGEQTQSCNNQPCPVDGNWTEWQDWRRCPVTCGGGVQDRFRSCTNPRPAYGGADCIGERREVRECNKIPCPVDGSWARWQAWGKCTLTCGGGEQSRTRDCSSPPPAHGGRDCPGRSMQVSTCNTRPCPVDGNWSAWRAWGRCSRSCGGGTQKRSRSCTNPRPAYGGLTCSGTSSETRSCNVDPPCPVPGGWAQWGRWDACSVTCGSGVRFRNRTCTKPPPSNGGAQCLGQSRQPYYCNRGYCPVDGGWSSWEKWGRCSATCNGGKKKRYRSCSNPPPSNGGKDCPGEDEELVKCNTQLCSVNGNWGRWDRWSACSKTCGGLGRMTRSRKCNNPPPANGGRNCYGSSTAVAVCYASLPCEVKCNIPLDFAILVDTSGSISRRNFRLLLRFIRSIIRSFEIGEELTHIALIEYSTQASVQLKFNDLTGGKLTRYNVDKAVNRIPHTRGTTYIDRALRLANEEVFTYEAGMRDYVKKVALVMTDGEQTTDAKAERSVNEILAEAAQPLKDKGISVISLGIGRRVNRESLKAIAASEDLVFMAKSFNALRRMVRNLKKGTCLMTSAGYKYPRYHGQ